MSDNLKVLMVATEAAPFAKVGGVGDVLGALPLALSELGVDVRVLLPLYQAVDRRSLYRHTAALGVPMGSTERWCAIWEGRLQNRIPVYFLCHDEFFHRPEIYGDYHDNAQRFSLLSRGALQFCKAWHWIPDVIHVHDWPTSCLPVYLNTLESQGILSRCASVLTIHNLGYQGQFNAAVAADLPLGEHLLSLGLAHSAGLNFLQGGLYHATWLNTVSPSYAQEIQTPAFGAGLDWLLRQRRHELWGILNGIDQQTWDPSQDTLIPAQYSSSNLSGKQICKCELQHQAGLPIRADIPLLGMITRLVAQKGCDLMIQVLEPLLRQDIQMVLLGSGDPDLEEAFIHLSQRYPERFHAWITFSDVYAHLIVAGADFFLMPSRYEPCGLTQMYSLRYGTLPIVTNVGGLADTVVNYDQARGTGTGFKFHDCTAPALYYTILWALETYHQRHQHIKAMQQQGMQCDFSWQRSAREYLRLYHLAMQKRTGIS